MTKWKWKYQYFWNTANRTRFAVDAVDAAVLWLTES